LHIQGIEMSTNIPIDEWIDVKQYWPVVKYPETWQTCQHFIFYDIRPAAYKVELAQISGEMKNRNELVIIEPLQTSMIVGHRPGFFVCISIKSNQLDKRTRRTAAVYDRFYELGQAGYWYLAAGNLFQGLWEVYNGPNPIRLGAS